MKIYKILALLLLTPILAQAQDASNLVYAMEKGLLGTVVYSLAGIVMLMLVVKIVDVLTPGKLFHQLADEKNTALAIFTGAVVLGISIIIAAAIAG